MTEEHDDSNQNDVSNEHEHDAGSVDGEGGAPASDTPTEETAVVDDVPPAAVDETQPAVAATAAAPPAAVAAPARERSSLTVPTWAAWVAGIVVFALLLGGSFALGRATGEDGDGSSQAVSVPSADETPRVVPGNHGDGNGNGNGKGH